MSPDRTGRLPLLFLALSFLISLLYSYLLSDTERGLSFLDPFNIGLNVFWLAVVAWLAWEVHRGAPHVRITLLVLACVVAVFSGVDLIDEDASPLLFSLGAGEALCFFAAYHFAPIVAPPAKDPAKSGWSFRRAAKYIVVSLGIVAIMCVGLVAAVVWWTMNHGVFEVASFDSELWSRPAAQSEDSCHRGGMAGDLRENVLKPGMSRADVERLLGRPDGASSPREYQYVLGLCSGLQTEQDNLHLHFDERGAFERAAIVRHPKAP